MCGVGGCGEEEERILDNSDGSANSSNAFFFPLREKTYL